MKKIFKINCISIILVLIISLVVGAISSGVFGRDNNVEVKLVGANINDIITDEYKQWDALSDEEKENTLMPRVIGSPKNNIDANLLGSRYVISDIPSTETKFSYRDIIPNNMVIKDQGNTSLCWDFASIAGLESTLALENYKKRTNTDKVYDYSEKYLDVMSTRVLSANNVINPYGLNREFQSENSSLAGLGVMTNGKSIIEESEMPFEETYKDTGFGESVLNKTAKARINDFVEFDSVPVGTTPSAEIINQMKSHIKNYGGIIASIRGANVNEAYTNINSGAVCVKDASVQANHGVLIIGWDDNYSVNKFDSRNRPDNKGAWIVKNSWGVINQRISYDEIKAYIIGENDYNNELYNRLGITNESQITNAVCDRYFEEIYPEKEDLGIYNYLEKDDEGWYITIGDHGFFYVSYEDYLIYNNMLGIIDADDEAGFNTIYQYNETGNDYYFECQNSQTSQALNECAQCVVFDRDSTKTEYLNEISLNVFPGDSFEVYVNDNSGDTSWNNLRKVEIETDDQNVNYNGYHTIHFRAPVKLNGDKFAIAVNVRNDNGITFYAEARTDSVDLYKYVKTESSNNYFGIKNGTWKPTTAKNGDNIDLTIKAFTTETKQSGIVNKPIAVGEITASANFERMDYFVKNNDIKEEDITIDIVVTPPSGYTFDDEMTYSFYITDKESGTGTLKDISNYTIDSDGKMHFKIKYTDIPDLDTMQKDSDGEYTFYLYLTGYKEENNQRYVVTTNKMRLNSGDINENNTYLNGEDGSSMTIKEFIDQMGKAMEDSLANIISSSDFISANGQEVTSYDITVADKDIPQTGEKDFMYGFGITFILGIGIISYANYKRIRVR